MNIFLVMLKLGLIYLVIIVTYHLMGKRKISELSIVDLIVFLILTNLITTYLPDNNQSFLYMLILMAFIIMIQSVMTYISSIMHPIKYMFRGKPSIIIRDGKLNFKEMMKKHYKMIDLLKQLELKGIRRIEDVNYALLENNGMLSIDYNRKVPLPIILNGEIQLSTLKQINKTNEWVNKVISKEKVDLKNIFYAFYNNGKIYIIKYE